MVARNAFACAVLVASLLVLPAKAQRVLLLPGMGSTVSVFANDTTLTATTPISASSGAFAILANPVGTRYFIVSSASVAVADAGGSQVQPPVAVGLPITAAALTPDGRKILVTAGTSSAGTLYIFDISAGKMSQLAAVPIGNNPSGVVANLDSRSAFVVTASGLSRVDLTTTSTAVNKTVALPGVAAPASKVVAGPNGFLYVNAEGALYEVNPSSMVVNTITMRAFPSKPNFTPDGTTALLGNPGASDTVEPALMIVDLATRTIKSRLNWFSVGFDYMVWGGPDKLYAYSGTHRKLYQLTNTLGGIDEADLPVVGRVETVLAAFNSTEFPNAQGIVGPKYLFVLAPSTLYRIDLDPAGSAPPDQITKSAPVSQPSPGGVFFAPPATANTTIGGTLQYGNNQSVAAGAESAPLVVRAVDYSGKPITGLPVTFTPSVGTILSAMTETNSDGLAEAIVKAPENGGEFSVTMTPLTGSNVVFMLNGGTPGGGETDPGAPGASGIAVLSGNGQVTRGGSYSYEPILLLVRDANGSPLPGSDVTFAVSSGTGGSIVGASCRAATGGAVCPTDSNGQLSVNFLAPSLTAQSDSWKQATITASVPGLSGVTTPTITLYETAVPAQTTAGFDGPLQFPKLNEPSAEGATFTVPAGQKLTGAIKVLSYAQSGPFIGTPMPNVGLQVRGTRLYDPSVLSPAVCVGGTVLSGVDGIATCDLFVPANTLPGPYDIFAISGGNTALKFILIVTAAPAPTPVPTTAAVVSGSSQSGTPGQTLSPLVAVVKDQSGNPMANVTVQWSVASGSATLVSPATKTGADGRASTGIVLGSTPGAVVVRMSAGNVTPAVFNLTITIAIGNVTKSSGDGQTVVIGEQFQPVSVKVADAQGNGIAGVSVQFNVTSGAATPSTLSAVTDATGVAAATFTATNNPGQIVVTASAGGKSVTFSLAARIPGPMLTAGSILNAASLQPGIGVGSIVAIKGDGLTTGLTIPPGACLSGVSDGNLQRELPTRLAGIEVRFEWTNLAPILAICKTLDGSDQINVQAPFELAPAKINVSVTTGIGTASQMTASVGGVDIFNAMPGIFEYDASSTTRAAVALRPDGTVVSPTNQAKRGEVIRVFTTGLGPVLPTAGVPVKTNQPGYAGQMPFFAASVQLGGSGAPGVTAEYAQNLIGVFVVTFQVPADAQTGAAVPLIVSVLKDNGDTVRSKASSIPIAE